MFDAYRVAVRLSVIDKVTPVLRVLNANLINSGKHVSDLEKKLKNLQRGAIVGGVTAAAGFGILSTFKAPIAAAIEYERALGRFKQLNLGDAVNKDANQFALGSQLFNVSGLEMISTLRDLHTAFGDYDIARKLAPTVSQLSSANAALFSGKGKVDQGQAYALERFTELRGGTHSLESFLQKADVVQKILSGTGGNVTASDVYAFTRRGSTAVRRLSDEGLLKLAPLIQELGGSSAGTAHQSLYNNLVGSRTTTRAAEELVKYGLVSPKDVEYTKIGTIKKLRTDALKNGDLFARDPIEWIKTTLLPALSAKGVTSNDQISSVINNLATNRTGSNLLSISATQLDRILKDYKVTKNAKGINETIAAAKGLSVSKLEDFNKRWEDLKIIIGQGVLPAVISLAKGFSSLFAFMSRHQTLTHALAYGFAALGAAMAIGGTILLLRTSFQALSLVMGAVGGGGLLGGLARVAAFGGLGTTLGAVAIGLGAVYGVTKLLEAGLNAIPSTKNGDVDPGGHPGMRFVKPSRGAGHWESDPNLPQEHAGQHLESTRGMSRWVPNVTVKSELHVDGKKMAESVSTHQGKKLAKMQSGQQQFDGNISLRPVGAK